MSNLSFPHDGLFKSFLGNLEMARSFLAVHLPAHIKDLCDLSTLKIESGSFVEENLRQHFSDILYSLKIKDNIGYIYTLLEHQSDAPPLMPFRSHRYVVSAMQRHLDQGHEKLPIVVPIIFYRGKRSPYPGPTDILACFEQPELAKEVFFKPFNLIDLSIIPDEELHAHPHIAALEIVQKHIRDRDLLLLIRETLELIQRDGLAPPLVRAMLYVQRRRMQRLPRLGALYRAARPTI